jgi:hypothetical protein
VLQWIGPTPHGFRCMAVGDEFAASGQRPGTLTGRVRVAPEWDTELVVECIIRAEADREPTQPPESLPVLIARFGTSLAQAMAQRRTLLRRLRVQAVVSTTSAPAEADAWPGSVTLSVYGEGGTLKRDDLHQAALDVITDRGRWHGLWPAVRLLIGTVEVGGAEAQLDESVSRRARESPAPLVAAPPKPKGPSFEALASAIEATRPAPPSAPSAEGRLVVGVGVVVIVAILGLVFATKLLSPSLESTTTAPPLAPSSEGSAQSTVPPPRSVATLAVSGKQIAQPTQISQPTQAISLSATPQQALAGAAVSAVPSPSVAPGPQTVLDTRFESGGQQGWPDNREGVAWPAQDGYHLRARTPGRFVAVGVPGGPTVADVLVSLSYRKIDGPPGGGVGIILRDQEPVQRDGVSQTGHFYVLEVSDRGDVGMWRRDADAWVDLVPWTRSAAVRSAADGNLIEARASGSRLALLVNGAEAASATDSALGPGGIGVFLGGDDNEAILEHLAIQIP